MPHLLRNLDNLEIFISKKGVHIFDLKTQKGTIRPAPKVLGVIKEAAVKIISQEDVDNDPQPSTSGLNATNKKRKTCRILDSESEDEEDLPVLKKKVVQFREPLTEVKGTISAIFGTYVLYFSNSHEGTPRRTDIIFTNLFFFSVFTRKQEEEKVVTEKKKGPEKGIVFR